MLKKGEREKKAKGRVTDFERLVTCGAQWSMAGQWSFSPSLVWLFYLVSLFDLMLDASHMNGYNRLTKLPNPHRKKRRSFIAFYFFSLSLSLSLSLCLWQKWTVQIIEFETLKQVWMRRKENNFTLQTYKIELKSFFLWRNKASPPYQLIPSMFSPEHITGS